MSIRKTRCPSANARRQAPSHRDAADFEVPRTAAGPIGGHVATATQPTGASPPAGASAPGSEPIEGSHPRVDCELIDQLNVILGFAGLLVESDRLDARHRRCASLIAASGARACAILRAFFQEHRAGSRTGIVLNEASSSPGPASPTRTSDGR